MDTSSSPPDTGAMHLDAASDATSVAPDSWTIFVYGHADHNLSVSLLTDMIEMASANLGTKVRVLVLADWDASATIPQESRKFPAGYFLYLLEGADPSPTVVDQGGELNLDDPVVVTAAASEVFKAYPAARYGVVFWDHGGGWRGGFGGDSQNRTTQGQPMPVQTLANALRDGLTRAGITGQRPLEFVAFDTCLMAGVEVVAPFAGMAKTFIGNAEIDYGRGWDYEAAFTWLAANPGAPAKQFAQQEVTTWDQHHVAAGDNDVLLRSHVALDLEQFDAFAEAVKAFAGSVQAQAAAPVSRAAAMSAPTYEMQIAEPAVGAGGAAALRDVGQVLRALSPGNPAAGVALQALERMRLGMSRGTYRIGQDGVHAQAAPARSLSSADILVYQQLAKTWDTATGWGPMLDRIRAAADIQGPVITGAATVPVAPGPGNLPRVDFAIPDADVMLVEGSLMQRHPTNSNLVLLNGYLDAAFVAPGSYQFSWDGGQWVIPASPRSLMISLGPWVLASTPQGLEIPLYDVRGEIVLSWGQRLPGRLLVDTSARAFVVVFAEGATSTVRPLSYVRAIDEGAMFVPHITAIDVLADTLVDLQSDLGVLIPASGFISIGVQSAEVGDYALLMRAQDHWGNESLEAFPITLTTPVMR